ncbi:MAG: IS66 family transposase [Acidobacteriota bacterium]|nr:MAG: IS66 family transposase [Acidobacteriota bacterium]
MSREERAAKMKRDEVVALLAAHDALATRHKELASSHAELAAVNEELTRQIEWFKRQLFGPKSERRVVDSDGRQLSLGEWANGDQQAEKITVGEHVRQPRSKRHEEDESELRFDESVPVEEILLGEADGEPGAEVVSEKVTYRLAQRPGSYVVLRYIRLVVKKKDGTLSCPPAPRGVLGKSFADVSLLTGIAIEKFRYHLPLYRQDQRLKAAGIRFARSTLTDWMQRTASLLEPIYQAQLESILSSSVLAMDETPIKAGRNKQKRRMNTGYFWPIYGDKKEVAFPFSPSRSAGMVRQVLSEYAGVLLSDGYRAYDSFAAQLNDVVHAQCWSHARRQLLKAEGVEPELTAQALDWIRRLYEQERKLSSLAGAAKLQQRAERSKPIVDGFFAWLKRELVERVLLPSNPWTKAAHYALDREKSLRVFLEYPDVPIDTNHLEREIRVIAIGRKNWIFAWTELGARDVGIFQSLLTTCRLQGVDPYTYLVDVLQRIDEHPMSEVDTLTPRLWKEHFAGDPLRSDLERLTSQ